MKATVAIVFLTIFSILGFAQPKMNPTPQSDDTFYSSLTNSIVFVDSFNTDLSAWTQYNGSWQIQSQELIANYDISCGSVGCPQAQLILKDQFQPIGDFRVSVNFIRAIDPNYPTYSQAAAEFCMQVSSNSRIRFMIGGGGDTWGTTLQDSITIYKNDWDGSVQKNPSYKNIGFQWLPTQWHKATLEKKGNIFKCYFDDIYLGEFVDNFQNGTGKIGLHTYGPKHLDNFVIEQVVSTSTKNLLYLKVGNPSDWTVSGLPGSQYKEIQEWQNASYTVTTKRLDSTIITSALLSGYEVLRLNTSQGADKAFTPIEATALYNWVAGGGKLFTDIVCDSNVTAVKQFGVSNVTRGANYGYWTYGGAPLRTTSATGPASPTGIVAFECMNVASLTAGSTLKIAATYDTKPAIVYGQFGTGKVVINFTSGWSHDITWPGNTYRADITQESNIPYLKNVITYFTPTNNNSLLAPIITSIKDVPNDNGKQVWITWIYPKPAASNNITAFGVWRNDSVWTYVSETRTTNDSVYRVVAPTLYDSTKTKGQSLAMFKISAHTIDPSIFSVSQPISGYSIDNLPPLAPTTPSSNKGIGNSWVVRWTAAKNQFNDFKQYAIYRSENPGSPPSLSTKLSDVGDTMYTDNTVQNGKTYYYKITSVDYSGNESEPVNVSANVTSVSKDMNFIPDVFSLGQNYPNPFNPTTRIDYQLPTSGIVILKVYNTLGQVVENIVNKNQDAGYYSINFDGSKLSSGIYFYKLNVGNFIQTKKMIISK